MSDRIAASIPRNLMFRYQLNCLPLNKKWTSKIQLDEKYRLPVFGEFEQQVEFADIRAAWNADGMFFSAHVTGKSQSVWCRDTQLLESDGLQLWIDTRNTQSIHRASKFCHWFIALPAGGGSRRDQPLATMLKINRSREDSPAINRQPIPVTSFVDQDGYWISLFIPGACLNGWDATDHRQMGFNVAVSDRELGWQTLGVGPEFPISEDPSLWHSLKLADLDD